MEMEGGSLALCKDRRASGSLAEVKSRLDSRFSELAA
jgi:hypothetical protein